jgi:hypothetical protein
MSAQEEIPILITCGCETEVPLLEGVSKSQGCSKSPCGMVPCEGDACSPNFSNLSIDQKCFPQRYLKKTTTWQTPPSSSSYTVGQNAELMLNILKLLENEEIDNLLEKNQEEITNLSDNNTYILSSGPRIVTTECVPGEDLTQLCGCSTYDNGREGYCDPNSKLPCPTHSYTNPTPDACNPKTMPGFPAFISNCGGENIPLQPGQGRNATAVNRDVASIGMVDRQIAKYRISHYPTRTGYLKVWIRKKVQQFVWQTCPPGTPPPTYTPPPAGSTGGGTNTGGCGRNCKTWWPSGEVQISAVKEYVWESDEYNDDPQCEDIIRSNEEDFDTPNGTTATLEISKYSYVKGYTPDDPETVPRCNPDGFPIYNTDPTCGP